MKTFVFLFTLFLAQTSFAQIKTISGTVKDIQNETVPGATVRLLKATDSTLVKGEMTNENGKFQLNNLLDGTYILSITAIGQKPYKSVALTIDENHKSIILPIIVLLPAKDISLKEVVVTAKRPLMERDIDKTIVNVDAMISAASSNTLEVLEKTPGVTVSNDGDISLNGKSGVLVLIDGRATYMSGADLATYLKSLPGGLLDKIELMDNPPAKYDAAGSAIINIRLKKNRVGGFTGNISEGYSQGVYGKNNGAINLNYLYKKVNLFANVGYNEDKGYNNDRNKRDFYNTENSLVSSIDLSNYNKFARHSFSTRLGMDYAFSKKTTYGFLINLDQINKNGSFEFGSNAYNSNNALETIGVGHSYGGFRRTNLTTNLNFQHKFNNTGREISADINYLHYQSPFNWNLENATYKPDNTLISQNNIFFQIPSDFNIYTAKADYVHPLKNKSNWEAGVKSSIVSNDNDPKYFNVEGNINVPDYTKTNHFIYHENINAAYFNTRKNWKRLGLQLGIRAENTNIEGNQLGNINVAGSTFRKNYAGVFPSTFMSYKLDSLGNNTISTSISRRINRPNYQQLNPFVEYVDIYSRNMGNPMLNPQYQYRFDVNYQYKRSLSLGLQLGRFTDVIFQTTEAVDNIFINRPANVATGYQLIFTTNVSKNPTSWWSINTNVVLSYMELNGTLYNQKLNPSAYGARLNVLNQFSLKKGWSAELTGFYSSREISGQVIVNPRYRVYAAAQKKILKDKATIKVSIEDMFHSWIQNDYSVGIKQSVSYHTIESDTQRIGVAFTYRFGKDTFARKRKYNDNAADSEKDRAN